MEREPFSKATLVELEPIKCDCDNTCEMPGVWYVFVDYGSSYTQRIVACDKHALKLSAAINNREGLK